MDSEVGGVEAANKRQRRESGCTCRCDILIEVQQALCLVR